MSSAYRMPRPGLSKRKGATSSSKCTHSLQTKFKTFSKSQQGDAKTERATLLSNENDMSDLEDPSHSGSLKELISNWKKSRSSASSKRIDHSHTDRSSGEDRTIWTETSSLDSKKLSDDETTNKTTTTKKEAASNTKNSHLQRYHKKSSHKKRISPKKGDLYESHCGDAHGSTNSNVAHMQSYNINAGDANILTVDESITAEMERLKDMAQMMSEMNKKLSGENEAMMELMHSVQPRTKELMNQLRQERKEVYDLKAVSRRSSKDHAILKSQLIKLRAELCSERDKFNKLKSQVIQLKSQYIIKVSKLQQVRRNTKELIQRFRDFKEAHSMCDEERELLRTKLVEVVSKFDKLKGIASQFQEDGSITTRLHEVQHEKSILQDEKARLEARVREYEDLERRLKKTEVDAKIMADEYEGDLGRMRSLLEEKEQLLLEFEKDQTNMREENALISNKMKRLTEEHVKMNDLLESKDVELSETRKRLSQQDEDIRKLQNAYVQMTVKLNETSSSPKCDDTKLSNNNGMNTSAEFPRINISKDVLGQFESVINDVTDRTYSLRKTPSESVDDKEDGAKLRNVNLTVQKKKVTKDIDERRINRKVLHSPPVYESKSIGSSLKVSNKIQKSRNNVLKQFDEETQTEILRPVELSSETSSQTADNKPTTAHKLRTVARPISAKERHYKPLMVPRNVTKNNNSLRYAQGRQKIWRICRSHDPVSHNFPSRSAALEKRDQIRFKLKSNPTAEGIKLYGKLENVFDAIRAQEDGIERLKSQLDMICESSQIDDNFSDEEPKS